MSNDKESNIREHTAEESKHRVRHDLSLRKGSPSVAEGGEDVW